jgi:hypothetical protein
MRVILSDTDKFMSVARRMGLWFGSLLLGITLFSLLMTMSPLFGISRSFQVGAVLLIFRITMGFAFPAWCLYLPLVMAFKDAEEKRLWTLLVSGILIGPASLVLWGLILQVRGGDPQKIWHGDPLALLCDRLEISSSPLDCPPGQIHRDVKSAKASGCFRTAIGSRAT